MDCLSEHDSDKVKTTTLVDISCLFKRTGLLNTAYIIKFLRKVKGTFQQLHSFCIFIFFYSYNSCNLALYFLMVKLWFQLQRWPRCIWYGIFLMNHLPWSQRSPNQKLQQKKNNNKETNTITCMSKEIKVFAVKWCLWRSIWGVK